MNSYDDVIRLCREALDVLELNSAKTHKSEVTLATDENMGERERGRSAAGEFSSVVELVERIEKSLSDYRALLDKYEELADVEDLEFEDIVARVDALMDKLERFTRRQV